jgi:hypothetical protein
MRYPAAHAGDDIVSQNGAYYETTLERIASTLMI